VGCAVLMQGLSTSVFNVAGQAYILHVVPDNLRARAFSIMGGTQRIGVFVGPFLGAGAMYLLGLKGAFWVAVVAIAATAALCFLIPDLPNEDETRAARENADEHSTTESTSEPATEAPTAPKDQGLRQQWQSLPGPYRII